VADNSKKQKKVRLGWWILLAVIIVVAGLLGWRWWNARQAASQMLASLQMEPYQRRDLSASIYGTGAVQPVQTVVLNWTTGGIVGDVNVSVGQHIKADEVLMALDPESISVDILQAEIDAINAQNNLDDLYTRWEADLAQAKLDLLNAEEDLDDLENQRQIMNYQRCTDERIEELEDDLEVAENLYKIRQSPENLRLVNTAQANLDFCRADFSEREVAEAELELALGEARVVELQDKVDVLSEGPDPDRVRILEIQLSIAQSRLDSPQMESPIDGVVTVVSATPGDSVQVGQQAVRIDDLSTLYLDVQISEIDIPQVSVGQAVELVFDAYFETTFNGEVVEIAPVGQSAQGVVEYNVRISMENADERIKPGMTASVNIVVDQKADIFVVPNDAIVSIDGQETVYVRRNGSFEAVPVNLGSYSDYYSEVIEADIEEGEMLVLNPPRELTGVMPFNGPPGGGFGGFGN
jgi:HlyD family secretion protein